MAQQLPPRPRKGTPLKSVLSEAWLGRLLDCVADLQDEVRDLRTKIQPTASAGNRSAALWQVKLLAFSSAKTWGEIWTCKRWNEVFGYTTGELKIGIRSGLISAVDAGQLLLAVPGCVDGETCDLLAVGGDAPVAAGNAFPFKVSRRWNAPGSTWEVRCEGQTYNNADALDWTAVSSGTQYVYFKNTGLAIEATAPTGDDAVKVSSGSLVYRLLVAKVTVDDNSCSVVQYRIGEFEINPAADEDHYETVISNVEFSADGVCVFCTVTKRHLRVIGNSILKLQYELNQSETVSYRIDLVGGSGLSFTCTQY